jgi:hypothetical protein
MNNPSNMPISRNNAVLLACGAGLASAVLLMVAAPLTPLPVWLVALAAGPMAAAITVTLATALLSILIGLPVGLVFLIGFGMPILFLSWIALMGRDLPDGKRVWTSAGVLTAAWVSFGMVVITIGILALPGETDVAENQIRLAVTPMMAAALDQAGMPAEMAGSVVNMMAALPAIIIVSWMLVHLLTGMVAQAVLIRMNRAARPTPTAASMVLPLDIAAVLAFSAAFAVIGQDQGWAYLGRNLLVVAGCAFLLAGFAAAHRWTAAFRHRRWILGGVYASAVILQYPLLALALIGLIDQQAQARQRIAGEDP